MHRTRCLESDCDRYGEGGDGAGPDEKSEEPARDVFARMVAGRTRRPLAASNGTRIASRIRIENGLPRRLSVTDVFERVKNRLDA